MDRRNFLGVAAAVPFIGLQQESHVIGLQQELHVVPSSYGVTGGWENYNSWPPIHSEIVSVRPQILVRDAVIAEQSRIRTRQVLISSVDTFVYKMISGNMYQIWEVPYHISIIHRYFDTVEDMEKAKVIDETLPEWDIVECDAFFRFWKRGRKGQDFYQKHFEETRDYWHSKGCRV